MKLNKVFCLFTDFFFKQDRGIFLILKVHQELLLLPAQAVLLDDQGGAVQLTDIIGAQKE